MRLSCPFDRFEVTGRVAQESMGEGLKIGERAVTRAPRQTVRPGMGADECSRAY